MYHPDIKNAIDKNHLIAPRNSISTLIIPPLPYNNLYLNKFLEQEFYSQGTLSQTFALFKRDHSRLDYQFGIGDVRHLKQWLFTIIKWNPAQNIPKRHLSSSQIGDIEIMGAASHIFSDNKP
jgi:hypothetical protein